MDDTYAEVGTEVILREHTYQDWHWYINDLDNFGDPDLVRRNWSPEQSQYVGKKARITRVLPGKDWSGCRCCRIDIDEGENTWRVESMVLASEEGLLRDG